MEHYLVEEWPLESFVRLEPIPRRRRRRRGEDDSRYTAAVISSAFLAESRSLDCLVTSTKQKMINVEKPCSKSDSLEHYLFGPLP